MTSRRAALALLALLGVSIFIPEIASEYGLSVALSIAMWVALAESWVLLSGMTGYISLGHAVFYGLGAYVGVLLWSHVPIAVAIGLSGVCSGLFALAAGYPTLRVRGPYFVMLTFGLSELVKFVVIDVEAGLGVFSRIILGGPSLTELYYIVLGLAAAATAMTHVVSGSRFGYGLRAIRENETAAATIGIPVWRYKLTAFALSAIIPGMVGAVMVARSTYFEPMQAFDPIVSFTVVTIAIIGGSDDAWGPLVGAVFLVGLSEFLWDKSPQMYMILLGILLAAFVLFAPEGITGRLLVRRKRAVP